MTFNEEKAKAEQGYAWAQYQVGLHYYHGVDVTQDYAEAEMWFHRAASVEETPFKAAASQNKGAHSTAPEQVFTTHKSPHDPHSKNER